MSNAPATVVDCSTGEITTRPLTAEEIADRATLAAETEQRRTIETTRQTNETTYRDQAVQALTALQSILDAPQAPTLATFAQATAAVRQLQANQKDIAGAVKGLVKLVTRTLD